MDAIPMISARRSSHDRPRMPNHVQADPILNYRLMVCFVQALQAAAKVRKKVLDLPPRLEPQMRIDAFVTGDSRRLVMLALQKQFDMGHAPLLQTLGDLCDCVDAQRLKMEAAETSAPRRRAA